MSYEHIISHERHVVCQIADNYTICSKARKAYNK